MMAMASPSGEGVAKSDRRRLDEAGRIKRAYVAGVEPSHARMIRTESGRLRYEAIVRRLANLSQARLLDIGCGEGNLERALLEAGVRPALLVGIDLDRSKLAKARSYSHGLITADFFWADAESVPFRTHAFDVIVATEVLEHATDEGRFLSELHRLSPQKLVITVPSLRYHGFLAAVASEHIFRWANEGPKVLPSLSRKFKTLAKAVTVPLSPFLTIVGAIKARRMPYHDYWAYHGNVPHRLYTSSYLSKLLEENGLAVDALVGVVFALPFIGELEEACGNLGLRALASWFARLQRIVETTFVRDVDRSQNILAVCSPRPP